MKILLLGAVFFCAFVIFFFPDYTQGQGDPFNWTEPIKVESNDIYLQWLEEVTPGVVKSFQKVYRFKIDSTWLPPDQLIKKSPRQEDSRGGIGFMDAAPGKFNVDSFDDLVTVWQGQTAIQIMLPQFDTTEALWTNTIKDSIVNSPVPPAGANRLYVRTLDVDGDSLHEFIVAYIDAEDSVHFNLYDVDTTLTPTLIASFSDTKVIPWTGEHYVRFFIEIGDFNGDGTDELALVSIQWPPVFGGFALVVQIYDIENGAIVPKGYNVVNIFTPSCLSNFLQMALTSGQFKKTDSKAELALVANYKKCTTSAWFLLLLEASPDLQTLTNGAPFVEQNAQLSNYVLSVASGDLNNNERDEVVYYFCNEFESSIWAFQTQDNLTLQHVAIQNVPSPQVNNIDIIHNYNILKVYDVNQDRRKDIILAKNIVGTTPPPPSPKGYSIFIYSMENNFNLDLTAKLEGDEPQFDQFHPYSISVGNFDGFDFTIGQPVHYTKNNVTQPMVILNAPPIHFDVLNGQIYDVNRCYTGSSCDFSSKYVKTNSSSVEVSTKVHREWVAAGGWKRSGSVNIGLPGAGASVNFESYLIGKYGKHFNKDSTNITTVTIGVEVIAKEDDRIYATVTDYDLWEYPLYYGNEEFSRTGILTIVPNNVRGQWFPSKSYYALTYIPDHEVGNILSYYPYDTLSNNPNVSQTIRANYVSDSFTLDGSTSYDWFLLRSDFTSSQADTSIEMGVELGKTFAFGLTFSGAYSNKTYSTHKTSVTQQIELRSHLGSVNMSLGDVKYTVTPYAYWSKGGPLVVDYAVKPELAPPGFPNTWWQTHYSTHSDPTFVLPWKLDPEKGFSISEEAKRYQTSDIIFYPIDPLPGDTVTITARVRNYSLIATPSPVTVKFYIGDPDSGGVPIIGVNGSNTVSTDGSISERGRSDVEFKWVLPSGLPPFPRIYAILDKDNTITEIHENNNKGFNVLGRELLVGVDEDEYIIPVEYVLHQSYPNPFNPSTTIKYSLPNSDIVSLKVFDILGREVAVLVNEYKTAGTHTVEFNAVGLASGVYFYQLRAQNFVETKKMILLR